MENRGPDPPPVRIGELSRRVGVRAETLRAWERRYALLEPQRSDGGYRLYSSADEARVRAMTSLLAEGVAAAEAAQLAREAPHVDERAGLGVTEARRAAQAGAALTLPPTSSWAGVGTHPPAPVPSPVLGDACERMLAAVRRFDDAAATEILDRALARFSLDAVLAGLVLPVLAQVGERWARGELSIAQEHFCSELLRARLLALARGWGVGGGPLALLACPPSERHDLGLVAFGCALRGRGWRIAYLGADTPPETLAETAHEIEPDAIVVSAIAPRRLAAVRRELRALAHTYPVFVGGAAANGDVARTLGAAHLEVDPVAAADRVAGRPVATG